jgi:hypothetical protein
MHLKFKTLSFWEKLRNVKLGLGNIIKVFHRKQCFTNIYAV